MQASLCRQMAAVSPSSHDCPLSISVTRMASSTISASVSTWVNMRRIVRFPDRKVSCREPPRMQSTSQFSTSTPFRCLCARHRRANDSLLQRISGKERCILGNLRRRREMRLAISNLLAGLRQRGQLGPELQSKHRWKRDLHCSGNSALFPVAYAAHTFCSGEAKQPGKFRRASVVSNEFDIGHLPMIHIRCIFINLFV